MKSLFHQDAASRGAMTAHGVCLLLLKSWDSWGTLYPIYGLKPQRGDRCIGQQQPNAPKAPAGRQVDKKQNYPTAMERLISWIWSLSSSNSASSSARGYGTRSVPTTFKELRFVGNALPNLRAEAPAGRQVYRTAATQRPQSPRGATDGVCLLPFVIGRDVRPTRVRGGRHRTQLRKNLDSLEDHRPSAITPSVLGLVFR